MTDTPHHLAIIMDGNRRWARGRGWQVLKGHNAGVTTLREISEAAHDAGVRWLTVFAFSAQNWMRPSHEVDGLMGLMRRFLMADAYQLVENNVKFRVIGDRRRLSGELVELIEQLESKTATNSGLNLTVAIDYGGRQEITAAAKMLADEANRGLIKVEDINDDLLKSRMSSSALPDIDLLVRTGGEFRVSNFMLWDLSYAELYFTDVYWPDFTAQHLQDAMQNFKSRDRRFGGDGIAANDSVETLKK